MAAPTIRTVASYYTHQEYSVDFFGEELIVTVTPEPSVISRWIRDVVFSNRRPYSSHPLVVGVGVQWTPFPCYPDHPPVDNFADPPPGSYYSVHPADTLQLCVDNQCLIIQLSNCDYVPDELRSFLVDPQTTFVGVRNSRDAEKLAQSCHQLEIGELLDIRHYVRDSEGRNMRRCSFEEIVQECMGLQGVRLDPDIGMSDWSVYDLHYDQILQASLDVYVCSQLGVSVCLWEV